MPSKLAQTLIRSTAAAKAAWEKAAEKEGISLSQWLTRAADARLERQEAKKPAKPRERKNG